MKRWWPDTLAARTIVVLIVGVVVSNLLVMAILIGERAYSIAGSRSEEVAESVAECARRLQDAEPDSRRMIARSLSRPGLRLSWGPVTPEIAGEEGWRVRVLRRALASELGDEAIDALRLTQAPWDAAARRGRGDDDTGPARHMHGERGGWSGPGAVLMRGALPLADGTWLSFAAAFWRLPPLWTAPFLVALLTTTVVVAGVSLWAVRRASAPLAAFATAAERLGTDIDAPALAEGGPAEVRRATRAFNEMQSRLRRFVRDRTTMLAAISHDLRTPLTRLRLRAELLDDGEERRKLLKDLEEMQAMIGATLDFARAEAASEASVSFDLAALLQSLADDAADTGADVGYDGPDHAPCRGRVIALKRTFGNLVDNAVTYGGTARLSLARSPNGWAAIIDDNGPGIPEEDLTRVFEPFHRRETSRARSGEGVGLGLAIARSVILAHGGEIALSNRPEGGLRATVVLPG